MHLGKLKDDRAAEIHIAPQTHYSFVSHSHHFNIPPRLHFNIDKTEIQRYEEN